MQKSWDEILQSSRDFFKAHNLDQLAAALPEKIEKEKINDEIVEAAEAAGLTTGFVFPPYSALQEQTEKMVSELAESKSDSLSDEHQYASPWIQDLTELTNCVARERGDRPYVLLYSPEFYPNETRNLTADQLDKMFAEKNWTGLAAHEYLVLQRIASEANGDHSFDDYVSDTARSQWMWLLDSRVPKGVMMGYWNPAKKRVEIGWCKANNKNEKRGSHPTVVLPL